MKIVIAGGSGQVGTILALARSTAAAIVSSFFSRTPRPAPWTIVAWDAETLGPWSAELEGADVAIGLAGRNVNCRYTPETRRAIMDSRVNATRILGQAISSVAHPPSVWLQASKPPSTLTASTRRTTTTPA
jgi:NAD dependent epimerase/dehydratase family enzyme